MVRLVISLLTFLCKVVRALGLSVGNYQATLTIEGFKGVMQFDENESINTDMKYAADARNFDTRDGSLLPVALAVDVLPERLQLSADSAAVLHRRTLEAVDDPLGVKDVVFVVGRTLWDPEHPNGKTSYAFAPGSASTFSGSTLNIPSTYCSFTQYEHTNESSIRRDLLLIASGAGFSSNKNGYLNAYEIDSSGVHPISGYTTPYKFTVLARYGERVWGSGVADEPDVLCYSAPYNPADWSENVAIPEDGAGEIRQPTFDGDSFTALVPFGNSLLAFKKRSLWRITGLTPDEFTFQEQYGVGTVFPNTIVVYKNAVYFLTSSGLCVYDGSAVHPFQQFALRSFWKDLPLAPVDPRMPTAVVWRDKYILSLPTEGTDIYNTQAIIFDFNEGSWRQGPESLRASAYVEIDDKLYLLQPTTQGVTKTYRWYGSIEETPTASLPDVTDFLGFDWLTPWSDMGAKDILKNEFRLRFWIQTHMASGDKLKLAVTVETERGSKTREIIFDRDVDEEIKMRFHLSGRKVRMRFKLTDKDGNEQITSWCKIMGGMQLNADTSPD